MNQVTEKNTNVSSQYNLTDQVKPVHVELKELI